MSKKWYVVHTYTGYEAQAKIALEERARDAGLTEKFGEILIPIETVVSLVKGQKKTSAKKFFPGYILINMELDEQTWYLVKDTPKITGFVGHGMNPPAVPDEEIRRITIGVTTSEAKPKPSVTFEKGEQIRVVDGPFANFSGVVDEIRPEKSKLRVMVSIFGRSTPVELDFMQVERL